MGRWDRWDMPGDDDAPYYPPARPTRRYQPGRSDTDLQQRPHGPHRPYSPPRPQRQQRRQWSEPEPSYSPRWPASDSPGCSELGTNTDAAPTPQRLSKLQRIAIVSLVVILLLDCAASSVTVVSAHAIYDRDMAQAKDGAQQAQAGMALLKKIASGSLDASTAAAARQNFMTAAADFDNMTAELQSIVLPAQLVPHYGQMLAAVQRVAPLAATLAHAGIIGCDTITELVQRQAGVFWRLKLDIMLPTCARSVTTAGGLEQHGAAQVVADLSLSTDQQFSTTYTCG